MLTEHVNIPPSWYLHSYKTKDPYLIGVIYLLLSSSRYSPLYTHSTLAFSFAY